ncbi:helix-turn-helix domain-containing protein [Azospirillum himalayense]|uniref:Helix-turn-helix domain-containing protein n=1 Tax=Azospirillum himalayense TaxID=654847 RepID=A0ABW0G6U1_9PROT
MDRNAAPRNTCGMQVLTTKLRERARELGLTDAEVARRAGLAEPRYGHYVAGTRRPDYDTLLRLCRVLGTSPNDLLGFESRPDQTDERSQMESELLVHARVLVDDDLSLAIKQVKLLIEHRRVKRTSE